MNISYIILKLIYINSVFFDRGLTDERVGNCKRKQRIGKGSVDSINNHYYLLKQYLFLKF